MNARGLICIAAWSTKLLALAVMIIAVGEFAQAAICIAEERRRA